MHDILHHLAGQDARLPLLLQQQRTSPQQLAGLALLLYHKNTQIWTLQASELAGHGGRLHTARSRPQETRSGHGFHGLGMNQASQPGHMLQTAQSSQTRYTGEAAELVQQAMLTLLQKLYGP